jgi:hypothetical protein
MQQKTITIETTQADGVNIWGVSLGTGYPWFVELPIILLVMGFVYGMKKVIDNWFEKRRLKKLTDKFSNVKEEQKQKEKIEKEIWP